ncbi:MAG: PKD domain-containing protein [Owenweeksia sp.]
MKSILTLLSLMTLLITGKLQAQQAMQMPLSGTYTINPNKPVSSINYQSFSAAVQDLKNNGVSGPVIFNIKDTIFNTQILIDDIPGISSSSQVHFQSDPTNTGMPHIIYAANSQATNYVFKIKDVPYITIKGLALEATGATYGHTLFLAGTPSQTPGSANHITIEGNSIKTRPHTNSFDQRGFIALYNHNLLIKDNFVSGGASAMRVTGHYGWEISNVTIKGNIVEKWGREGIAVEYTKNLLLSENIVRIDTGNTPASLPRYPINLYSCEDSEVSSDTITGDSADPLFSLHADGCNEIRILHNMINTTSTATNYGLNLNKCYGSSLGKTIVANNMISIRGDSLAYGLVMNRSEYINCVYNSVEVYGYNKESAAFKYNQPPVPSNYNEFLNNSLSNNAMGYAVQMDSTYGLNTLDFNNYYSNSIYLAPDITDLQEWQRKTGFDINSGSANPLYVNHLNLHATGHGLNNKATSLSHILTDIDLENRSPSKPDIGADEFSPVPCQSIPIIHTSDISYNRLSVSWKSHVIGITTYDIVSGPAGFQIGAGTLVTGIVDTFYTFDNLLPNSDFCFYIRKHCISGDTSIWAGPYCFTTDCTPLKAPFIEEFNTGDLPQCWVTYSTSDSTDKNYLWKSTLSGWPAYGAFGITNNSPNQSYAIGVDGSSTHSGDTAIILESPLIDISNLWRPILSFDVFQNNIHSSYNQSLFIEVFDGNRWDSVYFTNTNSSVWQTHQVDLSYFVNDTIRIRLKVDKTTGASSPFSSDIILDNVRIYSSCTYIPDTLRSVSLNCNTMELSWSQPDTGTYALIEYGKAGFVSGSGKTIFSTPPFLLTGLQKNTLYDFYIANTCINDTTPYAGPFSFKTDSALTMASYHISMNQISGSGQSVSFTIIDSLDAFRFMWTFGDGNSDTGSTVSNTYVKNGTYFITLAAIGKCDTVFYTDTLVISQISIQEGESVAQHMSIYPNPSNGIIDIAVDFKERTEEIKISILTLSGEKILELTNPPYEEAYHWSLDLGTIPKGTYIITIIGDHGETYNNLIIIN